MDFDPNAVAHCGRFGTAARVMYPEDRADAAETVCLWVITAPGYAMFWTQYTLDVVRLRFGVPGFSDPLLKFPGATHELHVVALNPDAGQQTPDTLLARGIPYMVPVNIAHQFQATDDEMLQLADLAVQGIVYGALNPETSDAPTEIREAWLTSLVRTLAHIRGEEHAP